MELTRINCVSAEEEIAQCLGGISHRYEYACTVPGSRVELHSRHDAVCVHVDHVIQ